MIYSIEDLAYLAGLIDGEGTIAMSKDKQPTNSRGFRYRLLLSLANTNMKLISHVSNVFGVKAKLSWTRRTGKNFSGVRKRVLYTLVFSPNKARELLPQLVPFLQAKQSQAELAIHVLQAINRNGRPYSGEEWSDLEEDYSIMRGLNRGIN